MTVYISNIKYKTGELVDIGEIRQLKNNPGSLQYLKNLGISTFSRFNRPVKEYVRDVMQECVASSGLSPASVDAVVFLSTMFDVYAEHDNLAVISEELGLVNAVPFGMFINQCSNHSQGFLFARNLIDNERFNNVLLVGADMSDDSKDFRVMPNNTSVYSDAAVCALISRDAHNGYELGAISHKYYPEMARISQTGNIIEFIEKYSSGFSTVCDDMYRRADLSPADFNVLLTANYNMSVIKNLAELAKIDLSKAFTDNVGKLAHCFSYDQLIALKGLNDDLPPGTNLNIVAVGGFWLFSSCHLKKI